MAKRTETTISRSGIWERVQEIWDVETHEDLHDFAAQNAAVFSTTPQARVLEYLEAIYAEVGAVLGAANLPTKPGLYRRNKEGDYVLFCEIGQPLPSDNLRDIFKWPYFEVEPLSVQEFAIATYNAARFLQNACENGNPSWNVAWLAMCLLNPYHRMMTELHGFGDAAEKARKVSRGGRKGNQTKGNAVAARRAAIQLVLVRWLKQPAKRKRCTPHALARDESFIAEVRNTNGDDSRLVGMRQLQADIKAVLVELGACKSGRSAG